MSDTLRNDRANVFWALDAWFDTQKIALPDRAYLCAEATGIYHGQLVQSKRHFKDGLLLLGKVMTRAAVGVFIALREKA